MHERLVEDWLAKATERSYQTAFAQSLAAEGMEVLRVGHSPYEHGKDIIAIDQKGAVHAYQLKDGGLDLNEWEKVYNQVVALVETQVEHPSISGKPSHQPWLVISGELTRPVEDRIRSQNEAWRRRRIRPLKTIIGKQLVSRFLSLSANFWPEAPEESHRLFSLYLSNGRGNLNRPEFFRLLAGISRFEEKTRASQIQSRLAAMNVFANYSLAPFYRQGNHWEVLQGWTIAAAQIAWTADSARLPKKLWEPTFTLATSSAYSALRALASEAVQPHALRPLAFCELDEVSRSRCTICAGAIATQILASRLAGAPWEHESAGSKKIEELFVNGRFFLWGESGVPFFLALIWATECVRGDLLPEQILMSVLSAVVRQNGGHDNAKLPLPYDNADEAILKHLRRLFHGEKVLEMQASSSHTIEPLVILAARRLRRASLASMWPAISRIGVVRLIPDEPRDVFLWDWGRERGQHQQRRFGTPQSWRELLTEARRDENSSLPEVLRNDAAFSLMFLLCFPHRLSAALIKCLDSQDW